MGRYTLVLIVLYLSGCSNLHGYDDCNAIQVLPAHWSPLDLNGPCWDYNS